MQIVRTVVWLLVFAVVLLFTLGNWDQQVTVRIWQNLVWDTRLPAVVIVSFLLGLLPMWILLRGTSWRLNRRIGHLEQATRNVAAARTEPAPAADAAGESASESPGESNPEPSSHSHPEGPREMDPPRDDAGTDPKLKPE